jgi:uncharacterized phiE125 gp8 family phage protein
MECYRPDALPPDEASQTEDLVLKTHLKTARQHVEQMMNCVLMTQIWRCTGDLRDIVAAQDRVAALIRLPKSPVVSMDKVWVDGEMIADWQLIQGEPAELLIPRWPLKSWQVDFSAGYGHEPDMIPPALRLAILAIAGRLFDHPEHPISPGIRELLQPFRRVRLS